MANVKLEFSPKKKKEVKFKLIGNYVNTPGENNYTFNKYGIRDYFHTVFKVDYQFSGKLKGLQLDLLYIYNKDVDSAPLTLDAAFNKTNYHQINFIANVNF